jgi:capsular exopolysaccharide synthesis family protein
MSRIHEILRKAQQEGQTHRTRDLGALPRRSPVGPEAPLGAPHTPASRKGPDTPAMALSAAELALPPPPAVERADGVAFDPRLVTATEPQSLAAEQYRTLRTRIARAENGRALRVIVVTSPGKGDGKSLSAANLALAMAQEFQRRVLLVDADLRRPHLHRLFGVPAGPGLADVTVGAAALEDALVTLPDHHLTLLRAGTPPGHPAELLGSTPMRRALEMLKGRFDRIVMDAPPAAPLADVGILAPLADAVLLIVRAGVTTRPAIERALDIVDRSRVLGLVLNDTGGPHAEHDYQEAYLRA